jgi:hypothetical protein
LHAIIENSLQRNGSEIESFDQDLEPAVHPWIAKARGPREQCLAC